MGYCTYFSGEISLEGVHPRVVEALRAMLEKDGGNAAGVADDRQTIWIDTDWKNYNSEMEILLYRIAQLLPATANAEIYCTGEESEDRWLVVVEGNRVYRVQGEWRYDHASRQEFTPEIAEQASRGFEATANGRNADEVWNM